MTDGFDPIITIKKFFYGLFVVAVPVVFAYAIEFLQTGEFTPEFEVWIPFVVAMIVAFQNYWKHRSD